VCLDILRGASQLAQPYAAHLSKLLQEEGREQERALVEALGGCLLEVVAVARGEAMAQPGESMEVSTGSESPSPFVVSGAGRGSSALLRHPMMTGSLLYPLQLKGHPLY
jgi:hypothetical protein